MTQNQTSTRSASRMRDDATDSRLIGSDKVHGTAVYDPTGKHIGTIHRLMIDKPSGRVAYALMAFGRLSRHGSRRVRDPVG